MNCIITGKETMNKWKNMVIHRDAVEFAQFERDEENEKIVRDHHKGLRGTQCVLKIPMPRLTTTRDVLIKHFEARQKTLKVKLAQAMEKAKSMTTKKPLNRF